MLGGIKEKIGAESRQQEEEKEQTNPCGLDPQSLYKWGKKKNPWRQSGLK